MWLNGEGSKPYKGLHTALLGYADSQRKCCKNSCSDKCWEDVVDYPTPHKSGKADIYTRCY